MMSTVVSGCPHFTESKNTILIKGASEKVLESCSTIKLANGEVKPLSADDKNSIKKQIEGYASQALRVIGIAANYTGGHLKDINASNKRQLLSNFGDYAKFESEGTFLGFVGIKDPLREEVTPAIDTCKTAGIRVIMITGDSKITAKTIASECGILDGSDEGRCFTGAEFEAMSEQDKIKALDIKGGMVFARVEPRHKRELVKILTDIVSISPLSNRETFVL